MLAPILGAWALVSRVAGPWLTSGFGFATAVVTAVPAALSALADALDRIGKNPLMAFLLGALLAGGAGYVHGVGKDAVLRERAERRAIAAANARADAYLARMRAEFDAKSRAADAKAGSRKR